MRVLQKFKAQDKLKKPSKEFFSKKVRLISSKQSEAKHKNYGFIDLLEK